MLLVSCHSLFVFFLIIAQRKLVVKLPFFSLSLAKVGGVCYNIHGES